MRKCPKCGFEDPDVVAERRFMHNRQRHFTKLKKTILMGAHLSVKVGTKSFKGYVTSIQFFSTFGGCFYLDMVSTKKPYQQSFEKVLWSQKVFVRQLQPA